MPSPAVLARFVRSPPRLVALIDFTSLIVLQAQLNLQGEAGKRPLELLFVSSMVKIDNLDILATKRGQLTFDISSTIREQETVS